MPHVALAPLLPSIISGVGTLGAAALGSRSSNKATKAQSDANTQALQFQREQEAARRADFGRAMQAYEANRNALLQRYGLSVPSAPQPGGMGAPGAGPGVPGMAPGQMPFRGPMQGPRQFAPPQVPQPGQVEGVPTDLGSMMGGYMGRGGYTGRGRYGL